MAYKESCGTRLISLFNLSDAANMRYKKKIKHLYRTLNFPNKTGDNSECYCWQ